jgi:hypothetical protein
MAEEILDSGKARASSIDSFSIISNKDGSIDINSAVIELRYYESIRESTIRMSVSFVDTGNSVKDKSVLEGLPLVGTEKAVIKMKDTNKNKLEVTLYVNSVDPIIEDAKKTMVSLNLVSKEHIRNQVIRVNKRYDGKLSDHVNDILKGFIGTDKTLDIEETQNNYNFFGNNKKPFYICTWLAKKGIPSSKSPGKTAGYFFFETSKGYNFKSIDKLLEQKQKRKLIFNETPDAKGANIPEGYDGKVLRLNSDNSINVQSKLESGSYSTRVVLFDPFNCQYRVLEKNVGQTESDLSLAGKELPVLNSEFDEAVGKFSRTTYMLIDKGSLPSGTTDEQIEKSKEANFDPENILNQSLMRYNQLFTLQKSITIPGDFTLNAGDMIFVDIPAADKDKKNQKPNSETGGLYIISDLCHYVTPSRCLTQLNLIRDSYGRRVN